MVRILGQPTFRKERSKDLGEPVRFLDSLAPSKFQTGSLGGHPDAAAFRRSTFTQSRDPRPLGLFLSPEQESKET